MRREHQRIPAKRHEPQQGHLVDAARRGARSAGEPIHDSVRRPLESRLGHDFRDVRIHHDGEAHSAARDLVARAYTVGHDVVFGEGSYVPETVEGTRVLAHELTHVVQQSSRPTSADTQPGRVIDPHDPSELAAERATETIMAGDVVPVHSVGTLADSVASAPGAVVQRWGLGDVWDDVSGAASTVVGDAESAGSAVASGVESAGSAVASGVESAGSAAYHGYEQLTDFHALANGLDKGVDWVEKESSAATQAMVDSTSGIPVISQLAQGAAWTENAMTDVTGGVIKGAGDLASGVAGGIAHPIDAAAGMEGILEHTGSGIPFLGTTLKGIHGIYDLAANGGGQYGNSWGDLANHVFNPQQQSEDDTKYLGALGKGIVAPGDEKDGGGWQRWKDNPLEAASRAVTNIAPMVMGVGEAAAPEAAADATAAVANATDATAAVADTTEAASGALKPATAAGPQSIQDMIDETLGNAQGLTDGSKPLTTQGMGRNAPIVEGGDPAPAAGGGGAAPAAAPAASGPGAVSRVGDWFKGLFDSGESTPAQGAGTGSVDDTADRFVKWMQANGLAGSDTELSAPKVVKPADGGGNRPMLQKGQNLDPDSLYRRRRKW